MDDNQFPPIFDGHNDILLRLHMMNEPDAPARFLNGICRALKRAVLVVVFSPSTFLRHKTMMIDTRR